MIPDLLTYPPHEMSGSGAGRRGSHPGSGGGPRPWEGQAYLGWRMDGEVHREPGSWEERRGLGERVAQRLHGQRAVRGTERADSDPQFGVSGLDVCRGTEEFMEESASLILPAFLL